MKGLAGKAQTLRKPLIFEQRLRQLLIGISKQTLSVLLLSSHTLHSPEVDGSDRQLNARIPLKLSERAGTADKCGGKIHQVERWKRLQRGFASTETNQENSPTQQKETRLFADSARQTSADANL